jgi:hypothetical protein
MQNNFCLLFCVEGILFFSPNLLNIVYVYLLIPVNHKLTINVLNKRVVEDSITYKR